MKKALRLLSTLNSHLSAILRLLPAFTAPFGTIGPWEVVSSYSSATAPDSHGISCADPRIKARKELVSELVPCPGNSQTFVEPEMASRFAAANPSCGGQGAANEHPPMGL
jgi:hypothetical protein